MRAWTSPELPVLPGRGGPVQLFDTAVGAVQTLRPGPTARLYVCGITPYDATHLGHAATYLAFDQLVRVWRDAGHDVHYVQNVTDVDDPLLERATATGVEWTTLAEEQTQLFRDDMTWLRVLAPADYVGAVEAIPRVVALIERLQAAGAVYAVDDDLYYAVGADDGFGAVSGLDAAAMRTLFAERGGDPDRPGKRDPLDCLVWKSAVPGEPSWPSPFGAGRPGWHVECAAIALDHLGEPPIDVQGGGSDLIFPHHEMSASQAELATGTRPFAQASVHAAMIGLDGEKMSKSLGNLVLASGLRAEGADPGAVRLALLAQHYRTDRSWTAQLLDEANARLARWRAARDRADGRDAAELLAAVRAALADDLDTPAALAAVDAWVAALPIDDAVSGASQRPSGSTDGTDGPARFSVVVDALLGVRL